MQDKLAKLAEFLFAEDEALQRRAVSGVGKLLDRHSRPDGNYDEGDFMYPEHVAIHLTEDDVAAFLDALENLLFSTDVNEDNCDSMIWAISRCSTSRSLEILLRFLDRSSQVLNKRVTEQLLTSLNNLFYLDLLQPFVGKLIEKYDVIKNLNKIPSYQSAYIDRLMDDIVSQLNSATP